MSCGEVVHSAGPCSHSEDYSEVSQGELGEGASCARENFLGQLLLLLLQLFLHVVHLLAVLVDLLVAMGQLLVELLDIRLVVVELEELHLHVGPHHLVLQPLVPLSLEGGILVIISSSTGELHILCVLFINAYVASK